MQTTRIEIGERTDPGRDPEKQVNEDSLATAETALGTLCVVCDGMGGHASGQEASQIAVKTIVELVQGAPAVAPAGATLRAALREANTQVFGLPKGASGGRPGSTVVAVLVHAGGTEIAHVGDSRCYLVHHGAIAQITKDHSKVQLLVDAGYLRPEDAKTHPDANQIIRALGIAADVDVELRPAPLEHIAGDVLVLCSDGLSDLVEPEEILSAVASAPCPQAAGQLVELANARGGHDNITVLIARMKESAVASARLDIPTVAVTAPGTELLPATAPPPPLTPKPAAPGTGSTPRLARTEVQEPVGPAIVIPRAPPLPTSIPPSASRSTSNTVIIVLALVALLLLALGLILLVRASAPDHHTPVITGLPTGHPSATGDLVADDGGGAAAPVATSADPLPLPLPLPTASVRHRRPRGDAGAAAPSGLPIPSPTVLPSLPALD